MKIIIIIINGPCGIGKSTLAAKIHADIPLAFLLDIDAQRRFISGYREHKEESGKMMMSISNAILKNCLENNCDVITDKIIYDSNILDSWHEMAETYCAEIYEIILWAPKEVVMNRANERGWREDGLLTPEICERFWDKIDELKESRPQAHVINIENMAVDELYLEVTKIINKIIA